MTKLHANNLEKLDFARQVLQRKARDHGRTPVQWSAEPNAGFCPPDVKPWMCVNDDYLTVNAASQEDHSDSDALTVLQFWKRSLQFRKDHKHALVYGTFELLDDMHDKVFAYARYGKQEAFVTVLNLSGESVEWDIPNGTRVLGWQAGNYTVGSPDKTVEGRISLQPWEALLGKTKQQIIPQQKY